MRSHNGMRVLITDGVGSVGSRFCERLLERGRDVECVDNFVTGSKHNVAHLLGQVNFELLRHDVTFPLYIEGDQIYNLACPTSLPERPEHPFQQAVDMSAFILPLMLSIRKS